MPPADGRGAPAGNLERHAHKLATGDEIGAWLEELESDASELNDLERDIVRIARRTEPSAALPAELVGASRGPRARPADWRNAREAADFAAFVPALRATWSLHASTRLLPDAARPYDALLDDYDYGLRSERLEPLFARLADGPLH